MHTELFIGKRLQIIESTQKTHEGVDGIVVDETQYTFVLDTNRGKKRILKKTSIFLCNGKKIVGKDIEKSSFERLKQ